MSPPKRTHFNFTNRNEELARERDLQGQGEQPVNEVQPNPENLDAIPETNRDQPGPSEVSASRLPSWDQPGPSSVIVRRPEPSLASPRPKRRAAVKGLQQMADHIQIINDFDREGHLASMRQHTNIRRSNETNEQRNIRLETRQQELSNESILQRSQRLIDKRERSEASRARETADENIQRLEQVRRRRANRLDQETSEQREQRLAERRRRDARQRRGSGRHQVTYKCAVSSDNISYCSLGSFNDTCAHCDALHFPEERVGKGNSFGDCCLHGRIKHAPPSFTNDMVRLLLREHPHSVEFHKRIRNLNSCYALASFTVSHDRTTNSLGVYSFTAAGQTYHRMNQAAHPTQMGSNTFEAPLYGQIYFLDVDEAVTERLNHPLNHNISPSLLKMLDEIIRAENRFVQSYMMMKEVEEEVIQNAAVDVTRQPERVQLVFTQAQGSDKYGQFDIPRVNEVCVVLTLNADQSIPEFEMGVRQRGKALTRLRNTDHHVEPFTYPLFYPKGEFGYSINLPFQTPYAKRTHMSRLEFAQYRLAFRSKHSKSLPNDPTITGNDVRQVDFNALHFGGRLFQQYLVDTYIRVERDRIQWIQNNQNKIYADGYVNVDNLITRMAQNQDAVVGKKVILPSSFPGSTRYFTEHFEDAMAMVRRHGKPDYFVTMTCNPEWPEIIEAAKIGSVQQLAQDRPDLVARVAKLKFNDLIDQFTKKDIFGKVAAYMYTIEFQKRGLPHMHLLLIMHPEDKIRGPEELDDFISAEIPGSTDPELRSLVCKWMIHNVCGTDKPDASCMVNKSDTRKCRFRFPKSFQELTTFSNNETSVKYRRRYIPELDSNSPVFSHDLAVYRKDARQQRITRDNRHVASYNAYLLKRFNCHINVDWVGNIMGVKYIYKYIYKGHDCAAINVVGDSRVMNYNEPNTYVEGRCITPPEACWRLFGNALQKKSHSVQRLDIHLEGKYHMQNRQQPHDNLLDIGQKGSMLEAYLKHNAALKIEEENRRQQGNPENVIFYLYTEFPEHYRWIGKTSEWKKRERAIPVVGRVYNVPCATETFYLRMLLFHVKNATSFADLRTVDGVTFITYKQACLARGLTFDDGQWIECLKESASSKMPNVLRTLFVQILLLGAPANPKHLWDTFKNDLAEDFIRQGASVEDAIQHAYRIIAYKINSQATGGRKFSDWVTDFGMDNIDRYEEDPELAPFDTGAATMRGEAMFVQLRGMQLEIVDVIMRSAQNIDAQRCFFVDGPGGTGKTFVYKALYNLLTGLNYKVQCMAFTGIAAILLPKGRTSHSTFGLRVPLTAEALSNIHPTSLKAKELAKIQVFLMDESPMLPKYGLVAMDKLLRTIHKTNLPFGGKVMVLGGDFRQCLPVQPGANRSELLDLSIKKCDLWRHFTTFSLTTNMRVDPSETDFADYLLQVGNGELPVNAIQEIKLPQEIISNGNLIDEVFGSCITDNNFEAMKDRAILAPLNKEVNSINADVIELLPGDVKEYLSHDSVKDPQSQSDGPQFTPEFLNSIEIADLPPHKLTLKKNAIIMLLRNLDVSEGMCNGTRLTVVDMCNNLIKAKIVTGEFSGKEVHIPRMTLDSSKADIGSIMQRHQFPVRPAFAMTIHKSQGQTFEFVGVELNTSVFMHGMLYVAFSRVKRQRGLKVRLLAENQSETRNIVWTEVFDG